MKRAVIYILLIFCWAPVHLFADALFYTGGGFDEGAILSETGTGVTLKTTDGKTITVPVKKISRTAYGTGYAEIRYIYTIDGRYVKGHIIGEDRSAYFVRETLSDAEEKSVAKSSVNFVSKIKIPESGGAAAQRTRVVIIEFDEERGAAVSGLAAAILLESMINDTGRYLLKSRTITKAALAAQKLSPDKKDFYLQVGRIYGAEVVVTGAVTVKEGKTLIAATSIRCATGDTIASGSVEAGTLEENLAPLDRLAHLTAGMNDHEYDLVLDRRALEYSRAGLGICLPWLWRAEGIGVTTIGFGINLFYYQKSFEADFIFAGNNENLSLNLYGVFYPWDNLGIGTGYRGYGVSTQDVENQPVDELASWESDNILIGVSWRPRSWFRAGLFAAIPFSSRMEKWKWIIDDESNVVEYETGLANMELLYTSWMLTMEYRVTDNISLKNIFSIDGLVGKKPSGVTDPDLPETIKARGFTNTLIATFAVEF